jgi:Glycosyl transferase family 11
MIIAHITGGLGNQLFQYAMARRLALQHKTVLLVDLSGFGIDGERRPKELEDFTRPLLLFRFRVNARAATDSEIRRLRDDFLTASTRDRLVRVVRRYWPGFLWKTSHIVERGYRFQSEVLSFPDEVYLQGFWQSWYYFADIAPLLRQEFQPVDPLICESARKAVENLRCRYGEVVSLHVRRGDLAHAHEVIGKKNITHGAPVSLAYIERAMEQFSNDTCFYVFSDSPKDIHWCRENINSKHVEFSTAESDLWDFSAMRFCDHNIIANSTFSWWAAWLNERSGRRVVAPRTWSSPEARRSMPTDDLIPNDWEIV